MKILKNIISHLHMFVLWLLASAFFWGWIFTFVTDTSPDKKVTVYCNVPDMQDIELAVALETHMSEGLRMIQVHTFDYVMFGVDDFNQGDIFILPASDIEAFAELLAPVEDGRGIKVYDAAAGTGAAASYIRYTDEDYYLFLGTGSVHLEDGKALLIAQELLALD